MNMDEKLNHIAALNDQLSVLSYTVVELRDGGAFEAADELQKSADELSVCIGELEHKTLEEWTRNASSLQKTLSAGKKEIGQSIDVIRRNMKTATAVIKAVKAIDKVVQKVLGVSLMLFLFLIQGCSTRAPVKVPPEVTVGFASRELTVDHGFFKIVYDEGRRLAKYVVYRMKREQLMAKAATRKNKFIPDPLLVKLKVPHVVPSEYVGTGYDRGHLAPSADFAWDQRANDLTFVMSNMAPQSKNLNQDAWKRLEDQVRKWGCGEGEVTVITGLVMSESLPRLESGLEIPQYFFKVVIDETPPKKVLSFIYHQSDKGDVTAARVFPLEKVMKLAGLNLKKAFPGLEKMNTRLPASIAGWKSEKCYN